MLHLLPVDALNRPEISFKQFINFEEEEEQFEQEEFDLEDNFISNIQEDFDQIELENFRAEIMRSLPRDVLCDMIINHIHDSETLAFTNFTNMVKGEDLSILVSPSKEDKIILLQVISSYIKAYCPELYNYTLPEDYGKRTADIVQGRKQFAKIISDISVIYNNESLTVVDTLNIDYNELILAEDDYGWLKTYEYLNYLRFTKPYVDKFIDGIKDKKLSKTLEHLYRIQLFTFASAWIDMNKYLNFLYVYYKLDEPEAE